MKHRLLPHFGIVLLLLAATLVPAGAQQHRARRLGHPATRFAPPLNKPEQLRALFANEKLEADVEAILRQARWQGNVADLRRAAASAPIEDLSLPVGTRMPYMASRKDGRPVALIDVLWDGEEPVSAYAFDFVSEGRRYRCITPRPCSNFYTVDLGPALPELALACSAPGQAVAGQRFDVYLTLTNQGIASEPSMTLVLKVPAEAKLSGASAQLGNAEGDRVWVIEDLQPGTAKVVCATFDAGQPAQLVFTATAQGASGSTAQTRCETLVAGIPAILLETADLDDPIEVGKEVVYEIKVTNQGSAPGTNLKVTCALPESQEFGSGEGHTAVSAEGRTVTMETVPVLAPKAQAVWRVRVKALKPDDARFKVFIRSDQFERPIQKDEATQLY